MSGKITWTYTDESPALASVSLLPLIAAFLKTAQVDIEEMDISLAGRILQNFPECLSAAQQQKSSMETLAALVKTADANIIKLPNASATDNQLKDAIKELQAEGYAVPSYPVNPSTDAERDIKTRYDALTGSVVNPVLRQGNAVRSIPAAIKEEARANPHKLGNWKASSKTRVATMDQGDFYATEASRTLSAAQAGKALIRFSAQNGAQETLKGDLPFKAGDIVDTAIMRRADLKVFLKNALQSAKDDDLLLSLHLKATMMKKTDGVIFGEALKIYFQPVFDQFENELKSAGVDPQNGLSDLLLKIETLDARDAIKAAIESCLTHGAALAMANLREGTNHLSSPNNVIVDVSMANLARWGGELQAKDGTARDTLAVIPDSTYARMHQSGIEFLKAHGSPDIKTMGSVTALRLQAEGAEEYGSKNTTFVTPDNGTIDVVSESGEVLHSQNVAKGDLWRMCRTSDAAIQSWLDLAADKAALADTPKIIIWLDKARPHDLEVIKKVEARADITSKSSIEIMAPEQALVETLQRSYQKLDTICVTGNLIGDHITDYFPILEIGSSSKMLSLIGLLNGGLVAETGSGGTAPDLISMVAEKNHFLWDDTGTALALGSSLRYLGQKTGNAKAIVLADTLEKATQHYIIDQRSPSPTGLDARQSHFYLILYWAQELAQQSVDPALQSIFAPLAKNLGDAQEAILQEIGSDLGKPKKMDKRYHPGKEDLEAIMRPSATFNHIIETIPT